MGFESKIFFAVFGCFLPLGSGSVNSHIYADPDPGSQNLADPTDPDPKHCTGLNNWVGHRGHDRITSTRDMID